MIQELCWNCLFVERLNQILDYVYINFLLWSYLVFKCLKKFLREGYLKILVLFCGLSRDLGWEMFYKLIITHWLKKGRL